MKTDRFISLIKIENLELSLNMNEEVKKMSHNEHMSNSTSIQPQSTQPDSDHSSESKSLDVNQLIELFKHLDSMAAGKETLFLPISFGMISIVLLKWNEIDATVVVLAGLASIIFYMYHLLVLFRFGKLQYKIFERIKKIHPDFENILEYPKLLRVQPLRIIFVFLLIALWVTMYILKSQN